MTLNRFIGFFIALIVGSLAFHVYYQHYNEKTVLSLFDQTKRCQECRLNKADLSGWVLRDYDLTQAQLVGADLRCADLRGVNLTGANLQRANLTGAKLDGANLTVANVTGAIFEDGTDCEQIPMTVPSPNT